MFSEDGTQIHQNVFDKYLNRPLDDAASLRPSIYNYAKFFDMRGNLRRKFVIPVNYSWTASQYRPESAYHETWSKYAIYMFCPFHASTGGIAGNQRRAKRGRVNLIILSAPSGAHFHFDSV